jgi:hypothetical protein
MLPRMICRCQNCGSRFELVSTIQDEAGYRMSWKLADHSSGWTEDAAACLICLPGHQLETLGRAVRS